MFKTVWCSQCVVLLLCWKHGQCVWDGIWVRQACSPLIQLFFGFASDIDQTSINRDIRDGNWLSNLGPSYMPCFWAVHVANVVLFLSWALEYLGHSQRWNMPCWGYSFHKMRYVMILNSGNSLLLCCSQWWAVCVVSGSILVARVQLLVVRTKTRMAADDQTCFCPRPPCWVHRQQWKFLSTSQSPVACIVKFDH